MKKPAEGSDFTNYEVFTIYCLLYTDHCLHNDDITSVRNVQPFLIRSSALSHFSFSSEYSDNLRELGILIILLLLMILLSKVNAILFSQLQLLVKFKANNYGHSLPTTTGCYNKETNETPSQ